MKAFILLPANLDASDWAKRFSEGERPDAAPYGYNYAQEFGCEVVFSQWFLRGLFIRLIDYCFKVIFGFDLTHAFRNLYLISKSDCDVIWTHTEREFLPLILFQTLRFGKQIPVIAQSVWLADDWNKKYLLHRIIAKYLCNKASACTFHSPLNVFWARQINLCPLIELVPFGVSDLSFPIVAPEVFREGVVEKVRVLALGNDKHRDWDTFSAAFLNDQRFDVRIASGTFKGQPEGSNWIARSSSMKELHQWYSWSDVVVVPLIENLHASGGTVLMEATLMGKPVVVSKVGGLESLFDDREVVYCEPYNASALKQAVITLASSGTQSKDMVIRAQAAIRSKELTSRGFAKRHVLLSRKLLGLK